MRRAGVRAGNECILPLDLVNEAVLNKEIKRPIGDRRLRPESFLSQAVKNCIGTKGPMLLQQHFQDLAANRRQAQPLALAARLGGYQRSFDATLMVMFLKPDRGRLIDRDRVRIACHVISYHVLPLVTL